MTEFHNPPNTSSPRVASASREPVDPAAPTSTSCPNQQFAVVNTHGDVVGRIDMPSGLGSLSFSFLPTRAPLRLAKTPESSPPSEMVSRITEVFPDLLDGRVRVLENTVVLVTDFVRSTELVKELERLNVGVTAHFNQLLDKVSTPIKACGGYPIGYHGDSVHALFLGPGGIEAARQATFAMAQSWMSHSGYLIPALRIGVAIGRIELGLLGSEKDRRLEPMGSIVVEAFRAASGEGYLMCNHPRAQLFFGPSMGRAASRQVA